MKFVRGIMPNCYVSYYTLGWGLMLGKNDALEA